MKQNHLGRSWVWAVLRYCKRQETIFKVRKADIMESCKKRAQYPSAETREEFLSKEEIRIFKKTRELINRQINKVMPYLCQYDPIELDLISMIC